MHIISIEIFRVHILELFKITLAYHVPDGANVPQVLSASHVTSGTLGTWNIDLLYKKETRVT